MTQEGTSDRPGSGAVTGTVTIGLVPGESDAVIEVVDDGPGMDSRFVREELFRPFRSTKSGGFGIGAFECREHVRDMGGTLDVESVPGAGTTFRITLSARAAPRPMAPRPTERARASMLVQ